MKFIPLGLFAVKNQHIFSHSNRKIKRILGNKYQIVDMICFFSYYNERKRVPHFALNIKAMLIHLKLIILPSKLSQNLISQFKLKRRSLVRTKEFHP